MTDEEKAKEYLKSKNWNWEQNQVMGDEIEKSYLDGLAEEKPEWHDLRKNPNDLPNTNREVLVLLWDYNNYHIGRYEEEYDDVIREDTYWHFDDFSIGKDKSDTVLGWFELPKVKR